PTSDHTSGSGWFAFVDDSYRDDGLTLLETPVLDFSAYDGPFTLRFFLQNAGTDTPAGADITSLRVEASADGGATFAPLATFATRTASWTEQIVSLASVASARTVIRFVADETASHE